MSPDASPPPIQLPPLLDLATAETLRRQLIGALAEGGISLDGAAVERIGTPCLQVLAAAALTARGRYAMFSLRRPSGVLRAAIADLGLCETIPIED